MADQNSPSDVYVIRHGNLLHVVSHIATLDTTASGSPAEAATVAHLDSVLGDSGIAKLPVSAGEPALGGFFAAKTDGVFAAKSDGIHASKPGIFSSKADGIFVSKQGYHVEKPGDAGGPSSSGS